jgi:hypothetical protein
LGRHASLRLKLTLLAFGYLVALLLGVYAVLVMTGRI